MHKGHIYKATNKINGKCYVGQTINYHRRKNDHISQAFNENSPLYKTYFHSSIRKYGVENFVWERLEHEKFDNSSELKKWMDEQETFYIKKFRSFERNFGYNMTMGGEGTIGMTGELNVAAKRVGQYGSDGNLIKIFPAISDAYRELGISFKNISLCCYGKRRSAGGYFWAFEDENGKLHTLLKTVREKRVKGTKIYAFNNLTGEYYKEYKSLKDAEKDLEIPDGNISCAVRKEIHSTGGYIFRYASEFAERPSSIVVTKKPKKYSPVIQFSLDAEYIAEYPSINDAFAATKSENITKCCNGLPAYKHAGGYLWMYKEDYDNGKRPTPYKNPSYYNPVVRLNLDYTLNKVYESFSDAAKDNNKNVQSIINYCRGVHKPKNSPYLWMEKEKFLVYDKEKEKRT